MQGTNHKDKTSKLLKGKLKRLRRAGMKKRAGLVLVISKGRMKGHDRLASECAGLRA